MAEGRIFVSVAAYRDTETPFTLTDLFAKAFDPKRVFVGVLQQVVPEEDQDCLGLPAGWTANVRAKQVHVNESRGACWARHIIQTELYQGEEYYLQIDSHTRFAENWDQKMIDMLKACPSLMPVLSTHPMPYEPPNKLHPAAMPVLHAKGFANGGLLSVKARAVAIEEATDIPRTNAFIGAGWVFSNAQWVKDVPYDPYLYFHGEEITLALRSWTKGYDIFSPNQCLIYHDYTNRGRPRHWSDNKEWGKLNQFSFARALHISGKVVSTDPEVLKEIDKYGLGNARTLDEYQKFADVRLANDYMGPRSLRSEFPLAPPADPIHLKRRQVFVDIFNKNFWGSAETYSGPGSTFRNTAPIRRGLTKYFANLGVKSLVDAGCGDLNWMRYLVPNLDRYMGYDIVPALVERNQSLYNHHVHCHFGQADIVTQTLPKADAILCRHVLTHLPLEDSLKAIALFKKSGARYLFATIYDPAENKNIEVGAWFRNDLVGAPFNLGTPIRWLLDGEEKVGCWIGIWEINPT